MQDLSHRLHVCLQGSKDSMAKTVVGTIGMLMF